MSKKTKEPLAARSSAGVAFSVMGLDERCSSYDVSEKKKVELLVRIMNFVGDVNLPRFFVDLMLDPD
uniref:Uncharacterized protein n=1 Tax=Oryza punctata TaxID=4537 RepID=A0A0E0JY56_ORYPU